MGGIKSQADTEVQYLGGHICSVINMKNVWLLLLTLERTSYNPVLSRYICPVFYVLDPAVFIDNGPLLCEDISSWHLLPMLDICSHWLSPMTGNH